MLQCFCSLTEYARSSAPFGWTFFPPPAPLSMGGGSSLGRIYYPFFQRSIRDPWANGSRRIEFAVWRHCSSALRHRLVRLHYLFLWGGGELYMVSWEEPPYKILVSAFGRCSVSLVSDSAPSRYWMGRPFLQWIWWGTEVTTEAHGGDGLYWWAAIIDCVFKGATGCGIV